MTNSAPPSPDAILQLTALFTSSLDPRVIRHGAIEAAAKLMNADAGSLLLVDEVTEELYFEVATGAQGEKLKVIRLRMDEGIAGWVARTGQGVVVADVPNDPRFFAVADYVSDYHTDNMIAAPVRIKGKTLGVLQALNRRSGPFVEADLVLFQALANQVAVAIENANLFQQLRDTFNEVTLAFASALEKRDAYTGGHTARVRRTSIAIGRQLGLAAEEMEWLSLSSVMHDIGKIGVPDRILQKQGRLDPDELAAMCAHPQHGVEILELIHPLGKLLPAVRSHHERFDGHGYPEQLVGEEIPLAARIIAVADAFDAMTTDRPYRAALGLEAALAELHRCAGEQFDPQVVEAFVALCQAGGMERK